MSLLLLPPSVDSTWHPLSTLCVFAIFFSSTFTPSCVSMPTHLAKQPAPVMLPPLSCQHALNMNGLHNERPSPPPPNHPITPAKLRRQPEQRQRQHTRNALEFISTLNLFVLASSLFRSVALYLSLFLVRVERVFNLKCVCMRGWWQTCDPSSTHERPAPTHTHTGGAPFLSCLSRTHATCVLRVTMSRVRAGNTRWALPHTHDNATRFEGSFQTESRRRTAPAPAALKQNGGNHGRRWPLELYNISTDTR